MIDEGEDGKRERKGQEEIGGGVGTEKGEEDGEWKRTAGAARRRRAFLLVGPH